jgi:hypothetical protein
MTALDWAAKLVEEEGEALARSFLKAAEEGDWRAADALMNRIYGKPEQAVVAHVAASPAVEVIRPNVPRREARASPACNGESWSSCP